MLIFLIEGFLLGRNHLLCILDYCTYNDVYIGCLTGLHLRVQEQKHYTHFAHDTEGQYAFR